MLNSRKIEDLHPIVQKMCRDFIEKCAEHGITVAITSTYRDHESQNELFAQGRTKPGRIVTKARGGDSYHNWRVAFDFVPTYDGMAHYDDEMLFMLCGKIGKDCGLEWGGDWKSFKDKPHLQYTDGLTLKDFKAGKKLPAAVRDF